jgi:hypothetical protein
MAMVVKISMKCASAAGATLAILVYQFDDTMTRTARALIM